MIHSALISLAVMVQITTGPTMDDRCRKEVEELHRFFQDWFNGQLEPTDHNFQRFSGVMAEGFEILSPDGGRMTRSEILARVREGHGSSNDKSFRIWIENYESRAIARDLLLVTYEEWQETGGEKRGRTSSAVFRSKSTTPNGVAWLHVHETWLPSK